MSEYQFNVLREQLAAIKEAIERQTEYIKKLASTVQSPSGYGYPKVHVIQRIND